MIVPAILPAIDTPTARSSVDAALIVAVPFYRNEHLVDPFVKSLVACSAELQELNARVIFFNDSPDHAPLGDALASAALGIGTQFQFRVETNPSNFGWLKTCNVAMREAHHSGADLLLFNSDTVVAPGALREMSRVAQLDPMIGFVNPRSNNATVATLPAMTHGPLTPAEAFAWFPTIAKRLPEFTYVPTAVGFAVLIRNVILAEFGYFDEIYGGGYNEENDLVMRASRCGYRAVLANHAFVWHQGEASLGGTKTNNKQVVEQVNREILLRRYPEYRGLVASWFSGVEHTAEQLLATLAPGVDGKLTIAFDFSSFGPFHSGTHKCGIQLLSSVRRLQQQFNVVVLCDQEVYNFHEIEKTGIPQADPNGPERYAAVLRVGQPFDWYSMLRMAQKGAVTGVFMLDTIALDCSHLYDPTNFDLWQHVIDQSDFIIYNSQFTARQFGRRFANTERRPSLVCLHSLDVDDYQLPIEPTLESVRALDEGYILVIGNQYPHKSVGATANEIARKYPDRTVVALGVTKTRNSLQGAGVGEPSNVGPQNYQLDDLPNLHGMLVGGLTDGDMAALQCKASVIVMPSHYEGFGLPILSALALRKPIIARRLPPFLEINERLGGDPNLHFFDRTTGLLRLLEHPLIWQERSANPQLRKDGERAVAEIATVLEHCISDASYSRIVERFRSIHTVFNASLYRPPCHNNDADSAAFRLGQLVERVARPVLKFPPVYGAMRGVYRLARLGRGTTPR